MSKKLFFLIGLLTGALLLELFHRPLKARLQAFEVEEAKRQKYYEFLRKDQQEYYDSLSPEKKMEYTVRMADWGDEDEEEE
jgi:hypothetical protein